ncbi:MAG: IclR family transcriptional regulator C-terminal domain-containing protein [Pseudomonadota bacterium]
MSGARYVLGSAFIEYDRSIRMTDHFLTVGRPVLKALVGSFDTSATGILCRFYRDSVMCVHQEQHAVGDEPNYTSYERGLPMPLFRGATSRVILASLSSRYMRRLYDLNCDEIARAGLGSDWKAFNSGLKLVRRSGSSVTHEEIDEGAVGVAAPVQMDPGHSDRGIGSISLVFRRDEVDERTIFRATQLVIAAGKEIEHVLSLSNEDDHQAGASPSDAHKVGV